MTTTNDAGAPLSPGIVRPVMVAGWTYTASYVPWFAARIGSPIPSWVMPVVGIAAGIIGVRLAKMEWSERIYPASLSQWAAVLAYVAGLAMAGWFYYASIAAPLHAAMWLVLAALPLGGWYWFLHRQAALQDRATQTQARYGAAAHDNLPPTDPEWTAVLEAAGFPGVHVRADDTPAGVTLTVRPNVEKPALSGDFAQKTKSIAYRTALSRPDISLREDDVRVEPAQMLPCTLIYISWKRPLRGTLTYVPADVPQDINTPRPLGVEERGGIVVAKLAAENGSTVAATGGGKSVETNGKIGRIIECGNALVWVGATDKLMPLIYPWVRPWLANRTAQPVIDWVAGQGVYEVLDMLADLYMIVRLRNARNTRKSKHIPTRERPAVIAIIDEATDLARRTDKVRTYDGRVWTASALLEKIEATDRSAGVAVYTVSQFALVDALGNNGSEVMRHINMRVCGRTNSPYDGQATLPALGNVDTTRLRDNMMLLQTSLEVPRVSPWKPYYLEDDELIEPVAIRAAAWRPTLEPEIASRLRSYPHRWDHGRLPELVDECETEGFVWPGTYGPASAGPEEDQGGSPMAARTSTATFEQSIDTTETVERVKALTAELAARILPEPLAEIAGLLDAANAPTDWVSSAKLAIVLGRVAPDAADDEIERASWQLGRDVSAKVPALKTTQRSVGQGRKARGYSVPRLRQVVAAIRAGEPVPEEEPA